MKMQSIVASSLIIFVCATLAGQTTRTIVEGRPASLRLSPHLTTTIRLPEPVNSVVVGEKYFHSRTLIVTECDCCHGDRDISFRIRRCCCVY